MKKTIDMKSVCALQHCATRNLDEVDRIVFLRACLFMPCQNQGKVKESCFIMGKT
jgi:hypothetical protein